jgi:signal transduction histidine kinase/PAS domain-containing protein
MPSESPLSTSKEEHLRLLNALRESELLRELSELLASSLDPTHILQTLVRRTTEVCNVERCAVWLLDESHTFFLPSAYHLSAQHLDRKSVRAADYVWHRSRLPFDDPLIHHVLRERGMVALDDLHNASSQYMSAIADKFMVHSILLVALIREGRPVGLMSLDNPGQTTIFSTEQQQLARAIGQQAAVAIHNARLYQQAQTERKRTERLIERAQSIYRVAMAVNSGKDLSTVLDIATKHLVGGLNAESVAIALTDAENDTLSVASTARAKPPAAHATKTYPIAASTSPCLIDLPHCYAAVMEEAPSFVLKERITGLERRWYQQLGLENVLIVPLIVGPYHDNKYSSPEQAALEEHTHCVGFAFVSYPDAAPEPLPGEYAFALDIAAQCALAIEKARIQAEVHRSAMLATERANTLDAVFNAMSEGIMVVDMEGQGIISNNTIRRFLNIPPDKPIQLKTILQEYPPYTLRGYPIAFESFPLVRALRGEQVRGERFMTRRADDSQRIVEVNVVPLFNSEAQQIGVVGAFRDVTEQVRVEHRIRRALDTMLHAAEAISGLTDIKDILQHVLAMTLTALNCDRGAVQLYNEEQQTFTPLLSIGFTQKTEVEWIEEQQTWLAPMPDQFTGFRDQLLDGHATLVSGEQCPEQPNPFHDTMILVAPITHNNHLQGVIMLDRSSMLKKGRSGDPNATRLLMNPAFKVWDITVLEGIAQFAGLAIEQARWQQEAEVARTNEAIMRESNTLKDEFLAITAHEFRTPLTVIQAHGQMMARVLRRTPDVEPTLYGKLDDSISIIEQQARQLTNIVNTFLEVTRLNRGQIVLQQEAIDLEDIVKQAIAEHKTTSPIHHISYHHAQAEHPYLVYGDKARLLQILANLLQNAIKYSPLGGPITVSLIQPRSKEGKKLIEVSIQDTGIGIPQDAQVHLFERFYRAPNVEGSKTKGIGLGLYVVAEFLHLHGGTIHVESSGIPGEGSRFIFTLPLLEGNPTTHEYTS